jgi:O-antigen ligase
VASYFSVLSDLISLIAPNISAYPRYLNRFRSVGSYGTRNIVVIGMMVWERPTDCIVLTLSKF